jgi:hypothetical protein
MRHWGAMNTMGAMNMMGAMRPDGRDELLEV